MPMVLLLLAFLPMMFFGATAPSFVIFYIMIFRTLVLATISCVMSCLTTYIAGLIPGWLSIVPSFAPSGIVLKFDFHLLSTQIGVVESGSSISYSFTATVASSPSLY